MEFDFAAGECKSCLHGFYKNFTAYSTSECSACPPRSSTYDNLFVSRFNCSCDIGYFGTDGMECEPCARSARTPNKPSALEEILTPKPGTRIQKSGTRNSEPETWNPEPPTPNHEPKAPTPQPKTGAPRGSQPALPTAHSANQGPTKTSRGQACAFLVRRGATRRTLVQP